MLYAYSILRGTPVVDMLAGMVRVILSIDVAVFDKLDDRFDELLRTPEIERRAFVDVIVLGAPISHNECEVEL